MGIPRQSPKAEPVKTGAVAPEVGRLTVGKLDRPAAEVDRYQNVEYVATLVSCQVNWLMLNIREGNERHNHNNILVT